MVGWTKNEDNKTLARKSSKKYWLLIKKAVGQDVSQLTKEENFSVDPEGYQKPEESEPLELSHGVEQVEEITIDRHKNENSDVKDVIKCESGGYLFSFENGNLGLYRPHLSGKWKQDMFSCQEAILAVTYSKKTKSFVAVCDDNRLRILDRSLRLINIIPFVGEVTGILYNEFTNEIVTYGQGSITVWIFRTAYTILIPKTLITDGFRAKHRISCCNIESTSSEKQRLFAAVGKSVRVICMVSGECVKKLRDCHNVDITALLFYQPLKLLVTAGKDGSIKVWSEDWSLNCLFVGHTSAINSLSVFPFGPYIISTSSDHTFKTWSLDNKDEIDCQKFDDEVVCLRSTLSVADFYCFTKEKLFLWRVKNLYSPFIVLGSEATILKTTTHPKHPPRSYAICDDSCVRIISPASAETITTMVVSDWTSIRNAEYMISEELLFVLLTNGDILKCDTTKNPCSVLEKWTKESTKVTGTCTSIVLYEYTTESKVPQGSTKDAKDLFHLTIKSMEARNRILLFGGCMDGKIVVYDWETKGAMGFARYTTIGHKDEITTMCACPRNDQLATTGPDMCVKIWRVFPFADEALAPLLMFNPNDPPTHIAFSRQKLCAITQNAERASYQMTIFVTKNADKANVVEDSHGMDHTDEITAIATCAKLRLTATAGMDRTIRIWSESGQLVRMLHLNDVAHSLCFSTHRADLLIGMGNSIHIIRHKQYLPQSYLYRLVAMLILDAEAEQPIETDENVMKEMSSDDRSRINHVHTSYMKFMQFIDDIPPDEQIRREEEDSRKAQAFALFKARDTELLRIKEGRSDKKSLKGIGQSRLTQADHDQTWAKYMGLFYTKPTISYPPPADEEPSDRTVVGEDDENKFAEIIGEAEYVPPPFSGGFFSVSTTNNPRCDAKKMKENLIKQRDESIRKMKEIRKKESEEKKRHEKLKSILAGEKQTESKQVVEKKIEDNDIEELVVSSKCLSLSLEEGLDSAGLDAMSAESRERLEARRVKSAPSIERGHKKHVTKAELRLEPEEAEVEEEDPVVVPIPLSIEAAEHYPMNKETLKNVNKEMVKNADNIQNMFYKGTYKARTIPLAPDGFLPNSIVVSLYRELGRKRSDTIDSVPWAPMQLTEEQLAELNDFNTKQPKPPPVEIDYDQLSEESISLPPIEGRTSILSTKLAELQKAASVDTVIDDDDLLKTPPPTPPPEPEPTPVVKKEKVIKPLNIVKYVAPKPKTPTPIPPTPTPPPPTPPRPKTPLPNFIKQFETHDWFLKCFPIVDDETIPKPHTLMSFIELLLTQMAKAHKFELKQKIVSAILLLSHQEPFDKTIINLIQSRILMELRKENCATSRGTADELEFLKKALQLILSIQDADFVLVAEMMVQFVLAQHMFRKDIMRTFEDLGLRDISSYFEREMETSFNVFGAANVLQRNNLFDQTKKWLQDWKDKLQDHIKSLAGKIVRSSNEQVSKGAKSPVTDEKVKGILKSETASSGGKSSKTITFVNDDFMADAADHVTPMEVINYFVEMSEEYAREQARLAAMLEQQKATTKRDVKRNTVLSAPKVNTGYVSLARLGETHTSKCHPERETNFISDTVLPPIPGAKKATQVRSLVMHINRLYLNPFPDPLDELLYIPCAQSQLITLQTSAQKYFFPGASVPPPEVMTR